jgi:uncharacterized membrane protein (DUF4010 family)
MIVADSLILRLAVALGIGLLIGLERERRKGDGAARAAAGLRTHALAGLGGGIALAAGGVPLLAVLALAAALFAAVAYLRARDEDPGVTSEIALVLTVLLGGLAGERPALAAGLGVVVTLLLAARTPLHRFVRQSVSADELHDLLLFAAAALVVLPLLPDQPMGPFGAINPHAVWKVVVLVMAVSAAGHVATRLLGPRFGLPLAGFASGFVSSLATIGAMGGRARAMPQLLAGAAAGAVLSTLATMLQMAAVLAAVSPLLLQAMLGPLLCGAVTALLYGCAFTLAALRGPAAAAEAPSGRAISLPAALGFAALLAVILLAAAALRAWLGPTGVWIGALLAGFADTHAAAASVAALVAAQKLTATEAVPAVLAALTSNTASKLVMAVAAGPRGFALRVVPGLLLVIAAAWAGAFAAPLLR